MTHVYTYDIDTFTEQIISLDEGARHVSEISSTQRNKRILLRWSGRGIAGVRLPTIRIGGELFTSREALNWFLNTSRQAKQEKHGRATSIGIAKAKIELEQQAEDLGI